MTPEDTDTIQSGPYAVLGGGSWGTALAHVLAAAGHAPALIVRSDKQAESINRCHQNPRYLQSEVIHPGVRATTDLSVLKDCRVLVLAVPCQTLRATLRTICPLLRPDIALVNAAKGLEVGSGLSPESLVQAVCPQLVGQYAMLSGPSFALEVVRNRPTAVVLACRDERLGDRLRSIFATDCFRTYSTTDVTGVELGGAVKNVIALGAGISDGLGFGHNARAALVTRGIAEMRRLGEALGARGETFMGLSGLGDLMLTCTGDLSRNRQVGLRLGQGESLPHITATLGMVAEGVKTAEAVDALATRLALDMPIAHAVRQVVLGNLSPQQAVVELMTRPLKPEGAALWTPAGGL